MPSDWARRAAERPEPSAVHYGSSVEFDQWLKAEHPRLVVGPEHAIVPLMGVGPWVPEREEPSPLVCSRCHEGLRDVPPGALVPGALVTIGDHTPTHCCSWCLGRITPGSLTYCPKCQASGYETRLARQLEIAGVPPTIAPSPFRTETGAIPIATPRKQRRARQFSRS